MQISVDLLLHINKLSVLQVNLNNQNRNHHKIKKKYQKQVTQPKKLSHQGDEKLDSSSLVPLA